MTDAQTPTTRAAALLQLTDITIRFARPSPEPELTIVENFDLELNPGTITCIAGRSGSGKTSLLRVAAGLAEATQGNVRWNGVSLHDLKGDERDRRRRATMGILDQRSSLLPTLTSLENVLLGAVPDRRVRHQRPRAEKLLNDPRDDRTFSPSPRCSVRRRTQRVGLARALLLEPPILILDEPTASLDRSLADTVIQALAETGWDHTAILVASHDPNMIAAAHHVLHIESNQNDQPSPPKRLAHQPDAYSATQLGSARRKFRMEGSAAADRQAKVARQEIRIQTRHELIFASGGRRAMPNCGP